MGEAATASVSASTASAASATASGLRASAGDVVLLWIVYAATVGSMLPGLWLLLVLVVAGGGSAVTLVVLLALPLLLWLTAAWTLASTFRQTLRSGTHIRRRHGRVPVRYHALALIAVTLHAVAVVGFVLIFAWAEVVDSPLPWVLFLGCVVGAAVVAGVTRSVWYRDGGEGTTSGEGQMPELGDRPRPST